MPLDPEQDDQIKQDYATPELSYDRELAIYELRQEAEKLARRFASLCPESRELTLAQTRLEEATSWAIKAIEKINDGT